MSRPIIRTPSSLFSSTRLQCHHRNTPSHHRTFTQSRPSAANVHAILKRQERAQQQMLQGPAQQSLTVVSKKHTEKQAPNDLGMMLGTLIMPGADKRPSLFGAPVARTRLEVARLWKRVKDLASIVTIAKWMQTPRGKIHFFQTKTTAMALHRQMYTAFAEGDNLTINSICTEGLRDRFRARIGARKAGERYIWTLHSYIGTPRVVSHRATIMPIEDAQDRKSSLRQAVVRIQSRQSLRKVGRKEQVMTEGVTEDIKEITEFLVIQKRLWKGTDEKWKVWGTTEETTIEGMKEALYPTIPEVKDGKMVQT